MTSSLKIPMWTQRTKASLTKSNHRIILLQIRRRRCLCLHQPLGKGVQFTGLTHQSRQNRARRKKNFPSRVLLLSSPPFSVPPENIDTCHKSAKLWANRQSCPRENTSPLGCSYGGEDQAMREERREGHFLSVCVQIVRAIYQINKYFISASTP